jgi:D-alanine-D-alanine ligase
MKRNLAVVFGGKSVEHDVSIITGLQLMDNADPGKYNVVPVYISREGKWFTGPRLRDVKFMRNFDPKDKTVKEVYISPAAGTYRLMEAAGGRFSGPKEVCRIDVAIPAMHGMHGEDGTLQGLFELANIPYSSPGVLGSAVGMDKIVMKAVFRGCGLPVLGDVHFSRSEWKAGREKVVARVEAALDYPVFVKPANLGSSIGIGKAADRDALIGAVEVALHYDRRVLVETGVQDIMEINCSCLGFDDDVRASVCEQPVNWEEFLTFEDKYLRAGKSAGMKSMERRIPAPIDDALRDEIQGLAVKVFQTLDCKGVVRIDFIVDKAAGRTYVNEINTIPGSFSYYLWEAAGVPFAELVERLDAIACRAHAEKNLNSYAFDSGVLKKMTNGAKTGK